MGWEVSVNGEEVEITQAVYFQEGQTRLFLNPDKGGYQWNAVLAETFADEALLQAGLAADPPMVVDTDEWHYQLLTADGRVIGHGDHYVSEEHVLSALHSLLDDREGVTIAAGTRAAVGSAHAALGKASETGAPHCASCGSKVTVSTGFDQKGRERYRAARDHEVRGDCAVCGEALPGQEVA